MKKKQSGLFFRLKRKHSFYKGIKKTVKWCSMPKKLRIFAPEKEIVERFEPLATTEKNAKLAFSYVRSNPPNHLPHFRFQ